MNANGWRYVLLIAVLVAVGGIGGITQTGCADLMVKDPGTNEWRPATEAEQAAYQAQEIEHAAQVAETVLVSTGQAAYIPFIDIGIRIVAALTAFFALQKQKKAAVPG